MKRKILYAILLAAILLPAPARADYPPPVMPPLSIPCNTSGTDTRFVTKSNSCTLSGCSFVGQVLTCSGGGGGVSITAGSSNIVVSPSPITGTGTVDLGSSITVSNGIYKSGGAFEENEFDNGNTSTAQTVAWNNGNIQKSTVTGNVTFTFTAPTHSGRFTLFMIENGTGNFTITLPSIKWPSGVVPVWSTSANAVNILSVIYDGTSYYGSGAVNYQ